MADALFVRNRRPNRVVFSFNGVRYVLERRGSREDSTSLPTNASNDNTIARWLKQGILEKIDKESFMELAKRTVDVDGKQFLKRPIRQQNHKDLPLVPAEADTTRSLTQISDKDVQKKATPQVEWAGDLMSTKEELESDGFQEQTSHPSYPSRHREDADDVRNRGY